MRPGITTFLVLAGSWLFVADTTNAQVIGQGVFGTWAGAGHQHHANGLGQLIRNSANSVQNSFSHHFHAAHQAHQNVVQNALQNINTANVGKIIGTLSYGLGHSIDQEGGSVVSAQSSGNGFQTSSESSTYSKEQSSAVVAVSVTNGQQPSVPNYYPQQAQQPQPQPQSQPQSQTDQEYYDQYYKDYYNNYYQTHPQYRPQAQHTQPETPVQPAQHYQEPTPVQPQPQQLPAQTTHQVQHQLPPQVTPSQPIVPVQPNDETHFRDHYNHNSPYLLTSYAAENYFNQPAAPAEPNYYIAPSPDTPKTDPEVPAAQDNPNLDGILDMVFSPVTQATPSANGKSLLDLLSTIPDSDPSNNDVAGGDFGLDVRSESRRKRSPYHYHYEEEDSDDDSDEDDHYHHHHHHHSAGRQHGHRRGHHNCNGRGPPHNHTPQPVPNERPSVQPDIRPIHENTGEEPIDQRPPLAPFPRDLPTAPPKTVPTKTDATPRDLSPEFNFDVRSDFNETRRRRDLSLIRDKRDGDSFVFGGDDDEKPVSEKSPVVATAGVAPGAAAPANATEEEEFEECELTEDDCEPASLDNRFGFLTGMRRRRPLGGLLGGIVQNVVHTIVDSGNQYNRDYQQYPGQPHYPQQPPYPQQPHYPHQPQYPPQPQYPHQPQYPQQPPYYQQEGPHQPVPHQPQYPGHVPQYQQSGAAAHSQSNQHGHGGSVSGASSDSTSATFEGPFGIKGTVSSSHSSSFNNGGIGGSSASANSGSGSYGGGAGSHASAGSISHGSEPEYYGDLPVFG